MHRTCGFLVAWALIAYGGMVKQTYAQVTIDQTFGHNGMARFNTDWYDELIDLELYQDSLIVVLAETGHQDSTLFDQNYTLLRLLPDGSLDPGFAQNGIGSYDFGNTDIAGPRDLLIQPDGKLLVVGEANTFVDDTITPVAISRLWPNGSIDSTFGTNGTALLRFIDLTDEPYRIALQPDGKILCTGATYRNFGAHQELPFIARLNTDGSLDSTFGGTGKIAVWFNNGLLPLKKHVDGGFFTDLQVLPDSNILFFGTYFNASYYQPLVARFHLDGTLDSTFGNNGYWLFDVDLGNDNYIERCVYRNDTLFVQFRLLSQFRTQDLFLGVIPMNDPDPVLQTIDVNGQVDRSKDICVLADGSLLSAGFSYSDDITTPAYRSDYFALGRLLNGQSSSWLYAIDDDFPNGATSVLALPDGKVILGGFVESNPDTNQSDLVLLKVDPGNFTATVVNEALATELDVNIYPNPATSVVTLSLSKGLREPAQAIFNLYTLTGQQVLSEILTEEQTSIDLNLPAGSYIYRVTSPSGFVKTGKLIVIE